MAPRNTGPAEARVDRIGPPSWWAMPKAQQIVLLIEGTSLQDAKVQSSNETLKINRIEQGFRGHALFVDATIPANAKPGTIKLTIEASGQKIQRDWQLLPQPQHQPKPFTPDDVIYLIMPDRFANGDPSNDELAGEDKMLDRGNHEAYHGGDFRGLREKLPYLADLGVTAIWLTPIYHQGGRWITAGFGKNKTRFAPYHGYAPDNYYDMNSHFGSMMEYREMVAEAHRLGLKVIQDQIVGYTGPDHPWLKRLPLEDWYHGPMDNQPQQTFRLEALANPNSTETERRGVTDGWFYGILPDLHTQNSRVRQYAIQQSLWWTIMGEADGIRLDTYPMVERDFWREWHKQLTAIYPSINIVGEAWTLDPKVLSFYQGGRVRWDGIDPGVSSVFDFPLYQTITDVFAGKQPLPVLAKTLDADFVYPRPDLLVTFLDNHDTKRLTQVGASLARAKMAAAFLLTARGIPQITWQDEIGLPPGIDHRCNFPGGFPGDSRDAFAASGRTPEEQSLFATWKSLLHLRRKTPAMRRGNLTHLIATDKVYAYMREFEGERVITVLSLAQKKSTVSIPLSATGAVKSMESLYGGADANMVDHYLKISMPAESASIFRLHD